jgi:hypothetical protein
MKAKHFICTAFLFSGIAQASNIDPLDLFGDHIYRLEGESSASCTSHLNRSWSKFGGAARDYWVLERKQIEGAGTAVRCAVRRGYYVSELIAEYGKAKHKNPKATTAELAKIAVESHEKLPAYPLSKFLDGLDCTATTPRISLDVQFTQTLNISCSSPKGPVSVNLDTMRVTVGGRDIWNSPDGTYLGHKF